MKNSLWSKAFAIGLIVMLLALVLTRISFLVDERRERQADAVRSVQQSQAAAQSVVGPWLRRSCTEEWEVELGEGKDRRKETQRREFQPQVVAQQLKVEGMATADPRYRGLFKVNGYSSQLNFDAKWPTLDGLEPTAEHRGSRMACGPLSLVVAVSDTRGVQRAELKLNGVATAVGAGTGDAKHARGLHANFEAPSLREPLHAQLTLDLSGTSRLDLVPAASQVEWSLRSDWPHPSFGGRFLPVEREVSEEGFHAVWRVSELASSAARDLLGGSSMCAPDTASRTEGYGYGDVEAVTSAAAAANCLDTFAVSFIDPVNPYVLADRAVKYGLLFVALTFVAVALTEVLARRRVGRVHPVQYALVGLALSLFFMLLLALSEHLRFEWAYAAASVACAAVLSLYSSHMLGGWRAGGLFGAALGAMYGLLYVLLTREQTALVVGTLGLFTLVAVVMMLTRRVDWYRLFDDLATPKVRAE